MYMVVGHWMGGEQSFDGYIGNTDGTMNKLTIITCNKG
jgi:hypothetical protein